MPGLNYGSWTKTFKIKNILEFHIFNLKTVSGFVSGVQFFGNSPYKLFVSNIDGRYFQSSRIFNKYKDMYFTLKVFASIQIRHSEK